MAFTNLYLIAGGTGSADINAGSSIGAAVGGPTTGGSWVNATNTFVAASGTPFASANVGDYVSVYVDGSTVTTYVAQITTVVSNVSVILSATIKYGTAPTDSANARSAVLGGSWNTEQVLAAGGLATTTMPQSTKINIKGNLTFAAARVITMAGATTAPLWFSGYATSPGDLDNDTTNSLTKPVWTLGTNLWTISGVQNLWSGLSVTSSRTTNAITVSAAIAPKFSRCRFENTSSNANATTFSNSAVAAVFAYCWFKTPATATASAVCDVAGNSVVLVGCVAEGGGLAGFSIGNSTAMTLLNCVGIGNPVGVLGSTSMARILGFTGYNLTTDGVKWTGTPVATGAVIGCLFASASGGTAITNGINNASGTNTNNVFRACNDYYNVTNPEVGFGDSPAFFGQTDSAFPLTSATNLTPNRLSNAINHGFPGIFENETFNSYLAIGAVQPITNPAGFFIQ